MEAAGGSQMQQRTVHYNKYEKYGDSVRVRFS